MKMEAPMEIGIAVRDLAGMVAFYVDVLGCTKVSEVSVPPDKSRANGLSPDGATVVRVQTPMASGSSFWPRLQRVRRRTANGCWGAPALPTSRSSSAASMRGMRD